MGRAHSHYRYYAHVTCRKLISSKRESNNLKSLNYYKYYAHVTCRNFIGSYELNNLKSLGQSVLQLFLQNN